MNKRWLKLELSLYDMRKILNVLYRLKKAGHNRDELKKMKYSRKRD